jgi:hypothetical protein
VTFTAKTRNSLLIPCSDAKFADFGHNLRVLDRNLLFSLLFPCSQEIRGSELLLALIDLAWRWTAEVGQSGVHGCEIFTHQSGELKTSKGKLPKGSVAESLVNNA